jgi:branched-chain amino acid transport system substrate-binding protein
MKKFGINIGVVILFLVVVFSCVEQKSENVKIGVILPLTGTYANLGKDVKNGIELAKWTYQFSRKEVNEDIELIYLDDKSSSVGGVSAIQNLIFKENPVAIIGGISSTTTMAIAPIAEKNKIVLISPTASSPQISDIGEYIFRVCASDLQEGIKMAQYLASENVDRIGIVYVENDYGQGLYNAFMSALSENLIKVKRWDSNQIFSLQLVLRTLKLLKLLATQQMELFIQLIITMHPLTQVLSVDLI